jgi:predicted nucleic acid-binding protein
MAGFTALYDACVLYPAPLRDMLMQLALANLFRAKWSNRIHDEWIKSVLRERTDLKREQLERTRDLMNAHVRDCLVEEFDSLIPALKLPDADDRHVLAAAIRGRADVIVTYNLDDFPAAALAPYSIEAQHPDDFLTHLTSLKPAAVCYAAKCVRARLKSPPYSPDDYLDTLARQRLPQTVAFLRANRRLI